MGWWSWCHLLHRHKLQVENILLYIHLEKFNPCHIQPGYIQPVPYSTPCYIQPRDIQVTIRAIYNLDIYVQSVPYTTWIHKTRDIYNLDTYNPCHIQPRCIQPVIYTIWIHTTRAIFNLDTYNPWYIQSGYIQPVLYSIYNLDIYLTCAIRKIFHT